MKKILALLLASVMALSLAACGGNTSDETTDTTGTTENNTTTEANPADAIPDTMTSEDGTYELAFVTDVGQLKDKSFNEGTWNGVKLYANENDMSYKYYQPANGDQATDDDRYDAMKAAVDAGATVVVCAGFLQEAALTRAAIDFPDVQFIFVDGYPLDDDPDPDVEGNILTNVAGIAFKEEQSGYFAGYAAVMEGYTKLGFSGGGGGTNPACCRYGYGFVQGANAAAAANDGAVIGVDVDQSTESDTVITSAMKELADAVQWSLAKVYDNTFSEIGGQATSLGVETDAVGLPTETWSMTNFTVEQYEAMYQQVKDGTLTVDDNYDNLEQDYSNLTLNII